MLVITNCMLATSCGDGVKDTEEACDDGLTPNKDCAYNEMSCTVCNVSCEEIQGIVRVCGDGIIDAEEVCDGGVNNSDTDANVCRTSCVLPTCGDGVVDTGEKCDAGDGNSDEDPQYMFKQLFL